MKKTLSYGRQCIDEDDINAVVEVMRGDWLTQGPVVDQFEKDLAEYCGAKHAIVVSSGTAALHIAYRVANCYAYEGITSPISFVATANAFEYNKIKPVFSDIENKTWNIDLDQVEHFINGKTRLFVPVHFAGLPCDMGHVSWLKEKYNFIVVEDACHALGASYDGNKIGSCSHSDMCVFSFHPVKSITTFEGGAILTNNDDYAEKARSLRTHGIVKTSAPSKKDPWYYGMYDLGINARISDVQCAVGISQLKKLDSFIERRNEIAAKYRESFSGTYGLHMQQAKTNVDHSYHLFVIHLSPRIFNRKKMYDMLKDKGINCQVHYAPIYTHPYYKNKYKFNSGMCIVAEKYYEGCLSIPMHPSLSDEDVDFVIDSVKELLDECRNKSR